MSNNRFLLDSSALLAFIEDEEGADRVEAILREGKAIAPWLVLLEITYVTRQERGAVEADRRFAYMRRMPIDFLWQADEATVLTAARLKAHHKISLADSVIAACSLTQRAVLIHKDPEFESLRSEIDMESLPYKARPLLEDRSEPG